MDDAYLRLRSARSAALRYSRETGRVAYVALFPDGCFHACSTSPRPLVEFGRFIYETRLTRDGWQLV